jgi:hypothetical protein
MRDAERDLIEMIRSCFTYGGAEKSSYNYKRFISKYESELGNFEEIYTKELEFLNKNATVEINVYTDSEGLTYNRLIIKQP